MVLSEALLAEFDQEVVTARKTLERVPEDRFDLAPHTKSWLMGWLAGHLANIPSWAGMVISGDELDLAPGGKAPEPPSAPATTADLVAMFGKNVREARTAIAAAADDELNKPWTLLQNGTKLMTRPKIAVLRSFVFNYLIHHRAQFGVYLRLNDIPVPAVYGPSADENPFSG